MTYSIALAGVPGFSGFFSKDEILWRAFSSPHGSWGYWIVGLFTAFLTVSLCGIGGGGGVVWARRIAVENRRWISDAECADIVSLCQFMPGPNIVGIAVCVGARMRGAIGTMAALAVFLSSRGLSVSCSAYYTLNMLT